MKKITLLFTALAAVLLSGGNVSICGTGYGTHDIKAIINRALVRENVTYQYTNIGEFPDYAKYKNSKVLIVCSTSSKKLDPQTTEQLKSWISNGGTLLLMGRAINSLAPVKDWKWSGLSHVTNAKEYEVKALVPDSPVLKGFKFFPFKDVLGSRIKPPAKAILGDGKTTLIAELSLGKGKIYVLANEYFRMVSKRRNHPFHKEYLKIIRNIIDLAAPTSDSNVQDDQLSKWQKKRSGVLVWNREWQRGEIYGPRFNPPMPLENEIIGSIPLHLARNEFESVQVNFTPLEKYKLVSWKLSSGGLPENSMEFFVQSAPDPIPWPKNPEIAKEFPYWLMPPKYVAPKGKDEFYAPKPGNTVIVWVRFNTKAVKAGNYTPELTLDFDGKTSAKVKFEVKVAKTAVPTKRPILLGVGGYSLDVNNFDKMRPFVDDLSKHGNEWSLINIVRVGMVKIAGTGEPFNARTMKKYFGKPVHELPELDFSFLDKWMHNNIKANMTNYRINLPRIADSFKRMNAPAEKLPALEQWFYSELSRYFHEKGVRLLLTSKGDELSRKELYEGYLPWAKQRTAVGFDCTSTFSFGVADFTKLVKDLSPYTRLWTLNRQLAHPFTTALKNGSIKLRDDAFVGTYGAGEGRGSEFRKPLGNPRFLGWESWIHGISTCSPNPWFKGWIYYCDYGGSGETGGIAGERWVAYLKHNDPTVPVADCPFWEGIREGMEEGNLAYLLEQRAKAAGKPELIKRARALISDKAGAPISGKWVRRTHVRTPFDFYVINADSSGYRKAKSVVLDMLDSLPQPTDVYWHRIDLKGVQLHGEASAIEQFKAEVLKRLETPLVPGNGKTTINFVIDNTVGKGKFRILEKDNTLTVMGGDAAGLKLGTEIFSCYLNQHGKW